ncbi:unnamed protein product [Amoebophrya sp. A120]|nr:unnamed protein product [Amoebophrya sp. A120]|eukprot:GSA120T00018137001.1
MVNKKQRTKKEQCSWEKSQLGKSLTYEYLSGPPCECDGPLVKVTIVTGSTAVLYCYGECLAIGEDQCLSFTKNRRDHNNWSGVQEQLKQDQDGETEILSWCEWDKGTRTCKKEEEPLKDASTWCAWNDDEKKCHEGPGW